MADLFVPITEGTESFVTFVLLMCDQRVPPTTTLTKLAYAHLMSTARFLFMIIKARLTPTVSCMDHREFESLQIYREE